MGRSEGVIFEYLKWGHELKKRKERKKEKNFLENSRGLLDENCFFFSTFLTLTGRCGRRRPRAAARRRRCGHVELAGVKRRPTTIYRQCRVAGRTAENLVDRRLHSAKGQGLFATTSIQGRRKKTEFPHYR